MPLHYVPKARVPVEGHLFGFDLAVFDVHLVAHQHYGDILADSVGQHYHGNTLERVTVSKTNVHDVK